MDDYNVCYECQGYGGDFYVDDNEELIRACDNCIYNSRERKEEETCLWCIL